MFCILLTALPKGWPPTPVNAPDYFGERVVSLSSLVDLKASTVVTAIFVYLAVKPRLFLICTIG